MESIPRYSKHGDESNPFKSRAALAGPRIGWPGISRPPFYIGCVSQAYKPSPPLGEKVRAGKVSIR